MVGFAFNSGNPENAIDVYMVNTSHAASVHMSALFIPNLSKYQCLSSKYPVYFVSRYNQLSGLDAYFVQEKMYKNPYANYSIGIYTLKKNCKGNTLSILDVYQKTLDEELEIK
jgi:hypothetical protein